VLTPVGSRFLVVADRAAGVEAGVEAAICGFIGVVFGSLSTAALTIYKERVTGRRELEQRDRQYERERATVRDVFQRDSILALQSRHHRRARLRRVRAGQRARSSSR
jgi:hypothetical protein